ncbi:urate hydroxylase PuuD [Glaciimonas sp. CA11.2]|uniref:urate hydroxylase PuuD n=1 Tax=Glaciimonas sp. CA11.2 TaxID=3048601 RepID=UPI002AB5AF3A|nr:urate hydroxylase PuuD [Glaciimonas sp. CA11.2]MDY7547219.1 urate hydroxylase PuuD [Glaciimonas sp. CA11.2]MEB0164815.1 urate hydroxylase PuuD [Glaciimonas sp. CA11.2]
MDSMLVSYGVEWLNLLVRWLHLIVGIAWIGASFYFVWLDNSIRPPKPGSDLANKGVSGELWAVHGGGFYNPQKYLVAPAELPEELHWFKWEAYATWLSGFAMLFIVYYFNASAMMINKDVADLSSWQAIGVGLGTLVIGWTVYDLLCRSPIGKRDGLLGIVMYLFIVAAAYVLSHLLSGRAAYIHIGAMIGTMMVGNVLMVIIPGQRKLVEAMRLGKSPDPIYGKKAKQRSVHNNYFTLPVLFIMISNHYAMTYSHSYNWLVLAAIIAAGALIRHFFNLRHAGRVSWGYPAAGVAILVVVAIAIAPRPIQAPVAQAVTGSTTATAAVDVPVADMAHVQAIITQRCVECHAAQPTQPGFATAPAGVMLQTPDLIRQHADKIFQQAVQLRAMPLGNMTNITDAERALIGAWYQAGAK